MIIFFTLALFFSAFADIPQPESALREGLSLFRDGEYDKAKRMFGIHLSVRPDDPIALYHLGLTETDGLKSKSYFERLLLISPKDSLADEALFEIGKFYYAGSLNLYTTARQEFLRLLKDYPDSPFIPKALYRIGLIDMIRGDYEAARNRLRKAIRADLKSEIAALAWSAIAESYTMEGDFEKTVEVAEALRDQLGMDAVASRLLRIAAVGNARMGNRARADSLAEHLITLFPHSDDAYRVTRGDRAKAKSE